MLERLAQAKLEMIKRVYAQGCVDKPPPIYLRKSKSSMIIRYSLIGLA
jgi:hypothetical protein